MSIKKSFAWKYKQEGSDFLVNTYDWDSEYWERLSPGEEITRTQGRFKYCEGDNSETLKNDNGELVLTRRFGQGCGQETTILH